MRKKTVITTEKREVWVIRPGSEAIEGKAERDSEATGATTAHVPVEHPDNRDDDGPGE